MDNLRVFNVLVVYTDGIAISAASKKTRTDLPFSANSKRSNYNDAYAYLLKECARNNLSAAFTTTSDVTPEGNFGSYWQFKKNKWVKIKKACTGTNIFDKFSPRTKKQKSRRKLLFSDSTIKPFNNPEILSLFFDKQKTFNTFSEFAIPTVILQNGSTLNIKKAYDRLLRLVESHPYKIDFSNEIVMKDRYGAGGNYIFKLGKVQIITSISQILKENKRQAFVLQPFANFNKGHKLGKFKGYVDIRIVYMGSEIIQAYLRKPKRKDFRCNEHQGGSIEYISKREIPKKVMNVSALISKSLEKMRSLYALDFIISNEGNVYLMEGNSGPGIDWNLSLKKNERNSKKLIREIVKELKARTYMTKTEYPDLLMPSSPSVLPILST